MGPDYQIIQTSTESGAITTYAALLAEVFNKPKLFTEAYIQWQYADNPDGKIVGFNAYKDDTLAAHYVAQPMQAMVGGRLCKGLLSLNTATIPAHQGKGLFVKLADKTYEYATAQGYDFVIGVANQNSVHGFIKKLGFQQVGQLHALLGVGALPDMGQSNEFAYSRYWTEAAMQWRLANPSHRYGVERDKAIVVSSATAYPAIQATLGIYGGADFNMPPRPSSFSLFNLWIGANRNLHAKAGLYFNIPHRLRPAPLYLIYKSLNNKNASLNFDDVCFQALDFDAY